MFYSPLIPRFVRGPLILAESRTLGCPQVPGPWVQTVRRFFLGATMAVIAGVTVGASSALYGQSLVFGNQIVYTTSAPQVYTLNNPNSFDTLNTGTVTTTGDFKAQGCSNATIEPGGICNISATFTPTAAGLRTGTLSIPFPLLSSTLAVPLQGTGIAAPLVNLSAATVTFAKQLVGSQSAAVTIWVINVGSASLHVSGVSVQGLNAPDFSPPKNNCGVVLPGSACSVGVTFTPAGTATRTATLLISDDAGNSPQKVLLSGIGVAPCDVNGDGVVNVLDVQLVVNQILGVLTPTSDINGDGVVNVVDLQLVVNAVLGLGCNH